jgi:hypothetical protein
VGGIGAQIGVRPLAKASRLILNAGGEGSDSYS